MVKVIVFVFCDNTSSKDVKNGSISNGCVHQENSDKRNDSHACNGEILNGTVSNGVIHSESDAQLRQRHKETTSHGSTSEETATDTGNNKLTL